MQTRSDPRELVLALLKRSPCIVQVAAVLEDGTGVFAWGWNHSGPDGLGMHAEAHCLNRSNPHRLMCATMYVAARRRKNGRAVTAKPCPDCQRAVWGVGRVIYRDGNGVWCG